MLEILITGDYCPARRLEDVILNSREPESVFGNMLEVINKSDLAITNLECPLTSSDQSIAKNGPNLKASPKTILALKNAGFDLVTLANNHIFDFGQQGLEDTLGVCREEGIDTVGAGLSLENSQKVLYRELDGKKIAIVNFAENEFNCATSNHGGANPMNLIDNFNQIKEARACSDFVLVIVHGGHELFNYPSPKMVKQYRFYAEQGVDAVVAHHTHCIGGYEIYKGVPIFYSLGNFLFDSQTDFEGWHEGYAVKLKIDRKVSFEILPYCQCRGSFKVELLDGKEKKIALEKIESISLVLKSPERLTEKWESFLQEKKLMYLYSLSSMNRLIWAISRRIGFVEKMINKGKLLKIYNMLNCESHRDASLDVLKSFFR